MVIEYNLYMTSFFTSQVKSSQVKSSQVKSSQVKSSQVKSSLNSINLYITYNLYKIFIKVIL